LKACDFRQLVEQKQKEHFHESREWLFEEVRQWVKEGGGRGEDELLSASSSSASVLSSSSTSKKKKPLPKRLFWLVGGAGTGKSVVSAQLLATAGIRAHIKAWHFCRHNDAVSSDVRVILQSWAAMLTCLLPNFRVVVSGSTIEEKDEDTEEEKVGKALAALNVAEMFDLLIAKPLERVQQAGQEVGGLIFQQTKKHTKHRQRERSRVRGREGDGLKKDKRGGGGALESIDAHTSRANAIGKGSRAATIKAISCE